MYTGEAGLLVPQVATGGFCSSVVDMSWAVDGDCLLAVSTDQTARIFSPWQGDWCEIARPQVWKTL
jgi:elongator complex protein 2